MLEPATFVWTVAASTHHMVMRMKRTTSATLFLVVLALPGAAATPTGPLKEWHFNSPEAIAQWPANAHLESSGIVDGAWRLRAKGNDPMIILAAPFEIPAGSHQCVEIRIKADRPGTCDLYWSNTTQGKYGGFSSEKLTRFAVAGTGTWETCALYPFWQSEKKIIRLRLDLYDGASFDLGHIRIVGLPAPAVSSEPAFDLTREAPGWSGLAGATASIRDGGLEIRSSGPGAFALSPPIDTSSEDRPYIAIRARSRQSGRGAVVFATTAAPGLQRIEFDILGDGVDHTYNIDAIENPDWRGRIVALGVLPPPGGALRVTRLAVADVPQGSPELRIAYFALDDPLPRSGRPASLRATIQNLGGEPASQITATLRLPESIRQVGASPDPIGPLRYGERTEVGWRVEAPSPTSGDALLTIASGPATAEARARIAFTARPDVPAAKYVPEPKPVRGDTDVGVYYFPGWHTRARWMPIEDYPERKPVLGWYREGDPEVADWHIKWAVEHGITFFIYDWYWSRGARHLEHGLHDAYFNARYRHLLKFCLLWANHNPKGTSSVEDCAAVTRFWIEHYFRRPEYFKIGDRPLMVIFSPDRIRDDLKGNARAGLDAMREECRKAGLPPVHLAACIPDASRAKRAAEDGYDSVTAYNWPRLGMPPGELRAPFATLPDAYRTNWEDILKTAGIPILLPLCGGWDSRPWHGDANVVRFGRTPEHFARHLRDARALLTSRSKDPLVPNIAIIEAWNEWGEGSYIEPHQEFAFGYLDAIREVFAGGGAHTDIGPADVGLGPYDLPPTDLSASAWNFDAGNDGWGEAAQVIRFGARDGALCGESAGPDPALPGPTIDLPADGFRAVVIRMRLQAADAKIQSCRAQLFWRTDRLKESEATQIGFQAPADGQWHEHRIDLTKNPRWRGRIRRLRFDPADRPGVQFAIDHVRLER